jgi:predicted enzyme related to lactoylglutathione lyase
VDDCRDPTGERNKTADHAPGTPSRVDLAAADPDAAAAFYKEAMGWD